MESSEIGHYTNAEGCLGILRGKLWATECSYLNDISELRHAYELAIKIANNKFEEDLDRKSQNPIGLITSFSKTKSLFSTSFSKKVDDLRQWMSYCSGITGYCIVFDKNEVHKTLRDINNYHAKLEDVEYNNFENYDLYNYIPEVSDSTSLPKEKYISPAFQNLVADIIAEAYNANENFPSAPEDLQHFNDVLIGVHHNIAAQCLKFKSEFFSEEQEARIIIPALKDRTDFKNYNPFEAAPSTHKISETKYRIKSGVIIPFKEISFNINDCIKRIIVSNVGDTDLAIQGLEHFKEENNLSFIIEKSEIPLRW